jgi:repressor LexA
MPTRRDSAHQPLGRRQEDVLNAIAAYVERHDRPPTIREIAHDAFLKSPGHAAYVLAALERGGHIQWERGVSRGVHLTRRHPMRPRASGVPILGTIAAGRPLDLFEPAEPPETLDLEAHAHRAARPDQVLSADGEYALLVRGNSMIEDGILDGDYVLVRPGTTAPEGAIVVAVHLLADGGSERGAATLKRLEMDPKRGCVRLCPANVALQPIEIPAAEWEREWEVQGTVTAIYRRCG